MNAGMREAASPVPEFSQLLLDAKFSVPRPRPGAQALAWFEAGHLAKAADAAAAADKDATRLGFSHHVFALDCLRALAGLALERRDLDTAETLTERALSISKRRE